MSIFDAVRLEPTDEYDRFHDRVLMVLIPIFLAIGIVRGFRSPAGFDDVGVGGMIGACFGLISVYLAWAIFRPNNPRKRKS